MIKVLFICHGNICRSPMAEFMFKKMVSDEGYEDKFYIESAATSSEECWGGMGNPVYPPARDELRRHGISCDGKRARKITRDDYGRFDYLIGMESANIKNMLRILGDDSENKVFKLLDFTQRGGDISDPWYSGDFVSTYKDIKDGLEGFLNYLKSHGKV